MGKKNTVAHNATSQTTLSNGGIEKRFFDTSAKRVKSIFR